MPEQTFHEQLQAALGPGFTIDGELAGGGMSRVFAITETELRRRLVVKVLHPELAAGVTAERFAREIRLVARLQQVNIVPLLTTGYVGDLPFYTMPLVHGRSLRERLREHGPLAIGEATSILRDVARALMYAHEQGVVHRDIKPENVLLSSGAAVVTDFGIAKALDQSRSDSATSAPITSAGVGVGTPAYIAPEQFAGDPGVDHRADIYAFGCLAYELLTGHPPFQEAAVHAVIAAHMTKTPTLVTHERADTPPWLSTLIMRCLEKSPAARPQSARELLEALDAVQTPAHLAPPPRARSRALIGAGIAAIAAVIAGIAFAVRGQPAAVAEGPPAIAVIPFTNVGGDSAQDYLADGISDELATAVGKVAGIRVAARSGAYRYRAVRDLDVREVGRQLGVAYVVQGSVRSSGDQLRISAQVTDARNGTELWSDTFNRTRGDVFRTQGDIVAAVSNAIAARVRSASARPSDSSRGFSQGTGNVEAYDQYLRGEFALRRRDIGAAVEMFRSALTKDSSFARAWAGLSQALSLKPYFTATPLDSVLTPVVDAAQRALSLDSSLAEAHMSLGIIYSQAMRWDDSRAAFERAVAADPNDAQTHFQFGRLYYYLDEDSAALAEWERASAIDPYLALPPAWAAQLLALTGRERDAYARMRRAWELDSQSVVMLHIAGRTYDALGDRALSRRILERQPHQPPWFGTTGWTRGRDGDRTGALEVVRALEQMGDHRSLVHTSIALTAIGLGDTTRAFTELERAVANHELWAVFHRLSDPMYDPLRGSARWRALVQRVGLAGDARVLRGGN